jgi:hypothetical protein
VPSDEAKMTNFSSLVIPVLCTEGCAIVVMGVVPVLVVVWVPPAFPLSGAARPHRLADRPPRTTGIIALTFRTKTRHFTPLSNKRKRKAQTT